MKFVLIFLCLIIISVLALFKAMEKQDDPNWGSSNSDGYIEADTYNSSGESYSSNSGPIIINSILHGKLVSLEL